VLRDGDIVGTDGSGRTAVLLVLDPFTLDRLLVFDADVADLEANDVEPETVLDIRPPLRRRVGRLVQAFAVALLLASAAPYVVARADQANMVAPLATSTAQTPQQCCRVCRKGQPCGDSCISAEKQCKRSTGCACSAASGS
jgi:hypothetical protein